MTKDDNYWQLRKSTIRVVQEYANYVKTFSWKVQMLPCLSTAMLRKDNTGRSCSKTSVNLNQTTMRHIPEDSYFHTKCDYIWHLVLFPLNPLMFLFFPEHYPLSAVPTITFQNSLSNNKVTGNLNQWEENLQRGEKNMNIWCSFKQNYVRFWARVNMSETLAFVVISTAV